MLSLTGDSSGLVLAPDLDSFYLVNSLVLALPRTREDVGQSCGAGVPLRL
jgi:hypothetical protein